MFKENSLEDWTAFRTPVRKSQSWNSSSASNLTAQPWVTQSLWSWLPPLPNGYYSPYLPRQIWTWNDINHQQQPTCGLVQSKSLASVRSLSAAPLSQDPGWLLSLHRDGRFEENTIARDSILRRIQGASSYILKCYFHLYNRNSRQEEAVSSLSAIGGEKRKRKKKKLQWIVSNGN